MDKNNEKLVEQRIFRLEEMPEKSIKLVVDLPSGYTQKDLIKSARLELVYLEEKFHGKYVYIYGRITTGIAMLLGHTLAHITKGVYLYDPKEKEYLQIIKH